MTDLDKLIEAVELAALPEPIFHGSSSIRGHWAYTTGLDAGERRSVFMAYNGSLDAAKELHEALIPSCQANIELSGEVWVLGDETNLKYVDAKISGDPARAWLIAILKAYRSKVQE